MSISVQTIEEALEDNGVKALVHGPAGAGKTVLTATMGMPTILISAESGLLSLKKYIRVKPEAKKYLRIKKIECFDDLKDIRKQLQKSKQMADWIALDSISEIAEQILKEEKEKVKDPRQAYGEMAELILDELRKFRDIPGYNVLMTAKQTREVDEDTGRTRYVPMFPGKQVGPHIPYLVDEVFALRVEEDDEGESYRTLQTDLDAHYYAKDRSGELDMFEKPNMNKILYKIHPDYVPLHERKKNKKAKKK